jgi:polyisoprenoid-binding protein YceI
MLTSLLFSLIAIQSPPTLGLDRYEIDARTSTVGFDGSSTLHDFTGRTHAITADLRADSTDPGRLVGGAVWIEARTLDTDNSSRDEDMYDLLDVKHYPQIVFYLDSVDGQLEGGKGEFTGRGRFVIRGVEKARVFHFRIDPIPAAKADAGHELRLQGEVRFNINDHGIKRPSVLIVKMADEVRVWFDLTLRPVPDSGVDAVARTLKVEEEFVPSAHDAAPTKVSGTELCWTSGARQLWVRRLEPVWFEQDAQGLVSIDPRSGGTKPAGELARRAMEQMAKPGITGTTWTTTVDEDKGRRTLRLTFADQVSARLPAWALDPRSWANGPTPAAAR